MREIARAVYNYFNMDDPYLGELPGGSNQIDSDDPFSENQESEEASVEAEDSESGQETLDGESEETLQLSDGGA